MTERFAIYYAPAVSSDLWQRASAWLGSGQLPALPASSRREGLMGSAQRYGFHATLKAPMALAEGRSVAEFETGLSRFAAGNRPVSIGPLAVRLIDGFLALVPAAQSTELTEFVQTIVTEFEPFRAPLGTQYLARRRQAGLTPRQNELLAQFGYPYVAEQFRFHMTLTDRLQEADAAALKSLAEAWFAPALTQPFILDRLVIFHEAEPGQPFTRGRDFVFGQTDGMQPDQG